MFLNMKAILQKVHVLTYNLGFLLVHVGITYSSWFVLNYSPTTSYNLLCLVIPL